MAAEAESEYILIGRIGAPHGVQGWVKLISFTDPPENILRYRHFRLRDGKHWRAVEVDQSRPQGKSFVGHIKGCDDRDQCRLYTGRELLVPKAELPDLNQGEYYWHQLIGLRVLNLADEDLGCVDHLLETGANDVLVIRGSATSIDGGERLIPYLPERVVRQVDLQAGILRVDWEADF